MSYGICGAHRTGKTTLARQVAEECRMAIVETSTSDVFRAHGIDPAAPMDFETRLSIQEKILDAGITAWSRAPGLFVTDRTPIDMIAYTICDITGQVAVGQDEHRALMQYINRCLQAASIYFSTMILVQPGIPLKRDEGKLSAALNESYLEHLNLVLLGILANPRLKVRAYALPRDVLDKNERVSYVISKIFGRINESESRLASFLH